MPIRDGLREFMEREVFGGSAPDDSADLLEAGLDSMGVLRLTLFIEERFGVTVPDESVTPENIRTIDALTSLVESLR